MDVELISSLMTSLAMFSKNVSKFKQEVECTLTAEGVK